MRRLFTACGVIVGLLLTSPLFAQSKAKAQNVPEIAYESVPNFLKFPPNLYLGEGIGVATNSKGHVFVYTRSGDTRLFEFDQNGTFVREIGAGLYGFTFAHAVRVDKDDNIWTVDEGSNMVIKFNPAGRVVMVIGRRPDAVDELTAMSGQGSAPNSNKPYSFNRPTDVAWDAQGNVYVADGGNKRIQVFDGDGNPKAQIANVGVPAAICITPGAHQYMYVSNSNDAESLDNGEIYKMELDGKIVGKFGRAGRLPKEFNMVNAIDCRSENELFVGELANWRVQKLTLHPAK